MSQTDTDQFSSRWGIILASLGMAIGAGNLWRFPRLAGQYGGTFILLWILFLFIWSIPLLLAEFAIGKKFKKGVIGSYAQLAGKKYTWMGFFITICTLGIAFYYSIVTAWALRYFGFSLANLFSSQSLSEKLVENPEYLNQFWTSISNANWITVGLYIMNIFLGVFVLSKGIQKGLEKANRILIPSLFVLLLIIAALALNMDNGIRGLEYMFSIHWADFSNAKIWIEALTQSAWSTGAGWGLMMTISSYSRKNEEITLNTFISAFGNNTASLVAGMAILPAVFALAPSYEGAVSYLQSGNQALTFTIIPKLFATFQGGDILSLIFFAALFLAAFSSLLPMIELFARNMNDLGFTRKKAMTRVVIFFIIFGFPSAYSLDFFSNQDWVWGVGLIVTGLFILFAVVKAGAKKFKEELMDENSDFKVSTRYFVICMSGNMVLAIFLIYWWLSQGYSAYPWFDADGHWNVFDVYSNATTLTQWAAVMLVGIVMNKFLYNKFAAKK
ncbi:sodium-dependent transporter [Reichenbachiella carrageenanivorans]|uniref:Sodium-dependent transporter n=1 Tax=Reichenbachiella carrageenanivorans TaxID=2979869 RepID=A0ABY6CVS1_9BACT|nr:sodium-dependent transporter [Reichenbachiella carrageenanivorans]UXX77829.1 sodium-dependent transporter [Reichenbachiella carrageenanivorans]